MSYLSRSIWIDQLKDWTITDCSVRDQNIIYLCLRKNLPESQASRMWDHDIETRQAAIYLDTPNDPYAARTLVGYNKPRHATTMARSVCLAGGGISLTNSSTPATCR